MKDFQSRVLSKARILWNTNRKELVQSAEILDITQGFWFFRVALSIVEFGNKKDGFLLSWCASASISASATPTIIIYKKDWSPTHYTEMKNVLADVLDGVGNGLNKQVIDEQNLIMYFKPLTAIERSLFP